VSASDFGRWRRYAARVEPTPFLRFSVC